MCIFHTGTVALGTDVGFVSIAISVVFVFALTSGISDVDYQDKNDDDEDDCSDGDSGE